MIVSTWLACFTVQRIVFWILRESQSHNKSNTMGSCICPSKHTQDGASQEEGANTDTGAPATSRGASVSIVGHVRDSQRTAGTEEGAGATCNHCRDRQNHNTSRNSSGRHSHSSQNHHRHLHRSAQAMIDSLVLETLQLIRTLIDTDQDPPRSMLILQKIADQEEGWLKVIQSVIRVIPMDDPLGPAVITLLMDECPLPTKEAIVELCEALPLSDHSHQNGERRDIAKHRNICVVLGCLADKMAGPGSVSLLREDVMSYLFSNLNPKTESSVILYSLIALEKFAQTSENKEVLSKRFVTSNGSRNALEVLESWPCDKDFVKREVGFCSQWCLDNLFLRKDRKYSFESIDNKHINVMLNSKDVSEYLKLSPDGLEARCDASSFESVRCTFQIDSGIWYYEVTIVTAGVMQIGWATKDSKFLNYEGYGIGDDEHSVAYDGCRQLVWHNAQSEKHTHKCWRPGDILGLLLDLENQKVVFSLNGNPLQPHCKVFKNARSGFFAAASFMSFQQCQFNFGATPFKFPPKGTAFKKFNDFGDLTDEEKVILPRHKKLQLLRELRVKEDSCTICCDNQCDVTLQPCEHRGFCMECAVQLEICPMCREKITDRTKDT